MSTARLVIVWVLTEIRVHIACAVQNVNDVQMAAR